MVSKNQCDRRAKNINKLKYPNIEKKYSLLQFKIKEENPKKAFPEVKVYCYRENA